MTTPCSSNKPDTLSSAVIPSFGPKFLFMIMSIVVHLLIRSVFRDIHPHSVITKTSRTFFFSRQFVLIKAKLLARRSASANQGFSRYESSNYLDCLSFILHIEFYFKAQDPSNFAEVIEITNRRAAGKHNELVKYLQMARKTLREPKIDTHMRRRIDCMIWRTSLDKCCRHPQSWREMLW